jgi:hypothetical protein
VNGNGHARAAGVNAIAGRSKTSSNEENGNATA